MGWAGDIVNAVREFFATDKDRKILDIQKGQLTARDLMGTAISASLGAPGYQNLANYLHLEHDLISRYVDYEDMDDFPEISSAIDIYADDATQVDSVRKHTVWASSTDERTKKIIDDLLHKTLRIEEDVWTLTRTLAKYGNAFAEILLSQDGVIGLNFLPPATMRRVEDYNGSLLGFVQDPTGRGMPLEEFSERMKEKEAQSTAQNAQRQGTVQPQDAVVFEDWEVAHWRLRSKHMRSIYGFSVLEPARWVWRRLVLLEDAVVLHKLTRAPGRYAFYIDTGDLAPQQALAYVDTVKSKYKKKKFVDANGKLDFKVNPLAVDEDFWIPARGGKESTRIEMISGADWQSLDDVNHFREKLFAAIKVPASYMGVGGESTRASLSQEDVRFARSVLRLQREVRNGLKKVVRVHLTALGLDPHAVEWDLGMTVPSTIFELAQMEVRTAQAQLAGMLVDFMPKEWILVNIFGLSGDEAKSVRAQYLKQVEAEGMQQAEIQAKGNQIMGVPTGYEQQAAQDVQASTTPGEAPDKGDLDAAREAAKKRAMDALKSLRSRDQTASNAAEARRHSDLDAKLAALLETNQDILGILDEVKPTLKHLKRVAMTAGKSGS
jgi:hypothetical protein